MHKIVVVISLILLTNCSRNAVINTHGVPFLEIKQKSLIVEKSNKNDVIKLIGPPSTKATFDNSVWIYIERTRTRGKLLKFGQNVTSKNNVLALEFDKYGILVKKDFYDKENIKKIAFVEGTTTVVTKETSFVYNFLSSVRQKINNPLKKKHRNVN